MLCVLKSVQCRGRGTILRRLTDASAAPLSAPEGEKISQFFYRSSAQQSRSFLPSQRDPIPHLVNSTCIYLRTQSSDIIISDASDWPSCLRSGFHLARSCLPVFHIETRAVFRNGCNREFQSVEKRSNGGGGGAEIAYLAVLRTPLYFGDDAMIGGLEICV